MLFFQSFYTQLRVTFRLCQILHTVYTDRHTCSIWDSAWIFEIFGNWT